MGIEIIISEIWLKYLENGHWRGKRYGM